MDTYIIKSRLKLGQLMRFVFVVFSFFLCVKLGYSSNIDQLCRSAPLLIDGLETKTKGLTELGSACYGSGENLKIRASVAISPGYEYLVSKKLHLSKLLKSFCETEQLYKLARRMPIVWTYYTMEGTFFSEFTLNMNMCKTPPDQK